jgi:hypothetical protein
MAKMAHIMKHVEWIWWNMVFLLNCESLTWKCVVWWEHGIGNEQNVWKIPNGVWKFVDNVLIIVVWSLVFVIVWSEEKMAHIVQYVEWIWQNVVFWLCCELSMGSALCDASMAKAMNKMFEELLIMFWFLLCEVQCFSTCKMF